MSRPLWTPQSQSDLQRRVTEAIGRIELATVSVQPGDVVVVTVQGNADPQVLNAVAGVVIQTLRNAQAPPNVQVLVLPDSISVERISEEQMEQLGWVRAEQEQHVFEPDDDD